jgi:pimeloyl-ACP methyl ester carboxylesterase
MAPVRETGGGKIWYASARQRAPGEIPLVLIHGAGGSHLYWPAELRRLPGRPAIVPDLPGHGRSDGPGRDEIGDYAVAVSHLLDAIGLERVVVGGHSMGGAIAQWMALAQPERVVGLVLIGTAAKLRVAPALLEVVRNEPQLAIETIVTWSFGPQAPDDIRQLGIQALTGVDPAVLYGDLVACDRFDIRHRLDEIGAPALVIGATEDRLTPLWFAHYLAENLPRAELQVVEGAGHMMALERPEEVTSAVRTFVDGLTDGVRIG